MLAVSATLDVSSSFHQSNKSNRRRGPRTEEDDELTRRWQTMADDVRLRTVAV